MAQSRPPGHNGRDVPGLGDLSHVAALGVHRDVAVVKDTDGQRQKGRILGCGVLLVGPNLLCFKLLLGY